MTGLEALEEIGTTLMFINKNTLESKPLKEVMPNYYNIIEKSLKALEIIKKHFIIKLEEETELNGNIWGRLVSIQAKEDKDTWDTTASANIVDYKEEFDLLKEVLE